MSDIEIFSMTVNDLEIIKDELEEKFDKFWTYGILKSDASKLFFLLLISTFIGYGVNPGQLSILNVFPFNDILSLWK